MYHCYSSVLLLVSVVETSLLSSGCCKSVTLSATGAAAEDWTIYRGRFEATGEDEEGTPVYKNSHDRYLYRKRDGPYAYDAGTWHASIAIGANGFYLSVDTAECPDSTSQWKYLDSDIDALWHFGNVTVQCSVHT